MKYNEVYNWKVTKCENGQEVLIFLWILWITFCSVRGCSPKRVCAVLGSVRPFFARQGPFSSASESDWVVSAFPMGKPGWAVPCDHAEILYALANGLLWKLVNGFRRTLSHNPPRTLLGLASHTVDLAAAKQLCPRMPRHRPPSHSTVIRPQTVTLLNTFHSDVIKPS